MRWLLLSGLFAAPDVRVEGVGQNASSHGFRTCPYRALRRRQDPTAKSSSLCVGSRRSQASLHQHMPELFSFDSERSPRAARRAVGETSLCYRCGWFVPGGCEPPDRMLRVVERTTIDPYDPHRCEWNPLREPKPGPLVRANRTRRAGPMPQ